MELNPNNFLGCKALPSSRFSTRCPKVSLRFVGGCVRNALWGEPVEDIDLACTLEPDAVVEALKAANIRYVPTGIAHGTVTAVIDGTPFEITSLRRDVATDGRRATVAYTTDWAEDAQRRDLTMNALYADRSGKVFDPTGQGLEDLKARKFRFVGDAICGFKKTICASFGSSDFWPFMAVRRKSTLPR